MPTAQKATAIEQAAGWYEKSTGVMFADYRGLKVKEMQQLRTSLRAKGGEIHVIKNTLFRRAVGDDAAKLPDELHNGPTAVAFVFQNESECAKALVDYAKTHKNLTIKGGFFGGKAFDANQVEALSKLPPRDVLIAQVIGAVAAPLSSLVGVIEALYADPIRVIGAVADKVAEVTPAAAKAEEPAMVAEAAPTVEAEAPMVEEAAETSATSEEPNSEVEAATEPAVETAAEEPAGE